MTNKITKEDVSLVCNDLHVKPTPEIVNHVMENYESGVSVDPEGNWYYIVEDLIHNYINNN
jgi:hypothetical protein